MYLGYNRIVVDAEVKTASDLTIPSTATGAVLQSDTAAVRYTCDNATNPNSGNGMLLRLTDPPFEMLIEDVLRIRFCKDGVAGSATLHVHYFGSHE